MLLQSHSLKIKCQRNHNISSEEESEIEFPLIINENRLLIQTNYAMKFVNKDHRPEDARTSQIIPSHCANYYLPLTERSYTYLDCGGVFSQLAQSIIGKFWTHHLFIERDDYIDIYPNGSVGVIHYMLQGNAHTWLNMGNRINICENTSLFCITPATPKLKVQLSPGIYRSAHIELDLEEIKLLTDINPNLGKLIETTRSNPPNNGIIPGGISQAEHHILKMLFKYSAIDTNHDRKSFDLQLLELIHHYILNCSLVNFYSGLSSYQVRTIFKIKESITEQIDEPLSLSQLAKKHHLSVSTIQKTFKAYFNESPRHYHSRMRLEKAREMLLNTDFSINEIALRLGYTHISSFTRAFMRLFGDTPSKHRK